MSKTHAICHTASCTCWDVDAFNMVGIAENDLDNGVMVQPLGMNVGIPSESEHGFEMWCNTATTGDTALWVVCTPRPNGNIENQLFSDPRYFYNEAGKPMSIKYLLPKVDIIEVTAEAFDDEFVISAGALDKNVVVGANGKFDADLLNEAPDEGTFFSVVGVGSIAIGQESVPSVYLRCERN